MSDFNDELDRAYDNSKVFNYLYKTTSFIDDDIEHLSLYEKARHITAIFFVLCTYLVFEVAITIRVAFVYFLKYIFRKVRNF